jgi:iron complex outermembrane receptor protein
MAIFKGFSAVLCASTALALAAPAWAQEAADENSGGIEDIVVTAQKRAESAQEVPIAISVFSGDALAERAITNVSQLTSVAPNVNFDNGVAFTGSTAVLAASIRGIGSSDFAFNIDPGVGVYVDGIYLARSVGANQDLLDTGRIEVLKGPQGTLFGRNTIGGAVSIVTRDPAKEFKARGDVTFGRFNMFEARAAVDVPLTDNLTSLITFDVRNGGAYGKRIPFPSALVANSKPYTALPSQWVMKRPPRKAATRTQRSAPRSKYDGGSFRVTLSGDYQHSTGNSPHSLAGLLLGDPAVTGSPNFTFLYNTCRAAPTAVLGVAGPHELSAPPSARNCRRSAATRSPPINRVTYTPGVNTGANPATHELSVHRPVHHGRSRRTSYATGNNFSAS